MGVNKVFQKVFRYLKIFESTFKNFKILICILIILKTIITPLKMEQNIIFKTFR